MYPFVLVELLSGDAESGELLELFCELSGDDDVSSGADELLSGVLSDELSFNEELSPWLLSSIGVSIGCFSFSVIFGLSLSYPGVKSTQTHP